MSEKRDTELDFSVEEKGQLPLNSNEPDCIAEEKRDQRNVATTSIPQLTLERTLSIKYRTLSIQTSDSIQARKNKAHIKKEKKTSVSPDDEIAHLDYHTISVDEILQRFESNENLGLDSRTATYRLQRDGRNVITPPKNNIILKILNYLLGGFCSLLWFAALICILSYKPLGEPNPAPINLALGIVLIIVVIIQAAFGAYQDWSTSKVMNSIKNMLPAEALVIRNGQVTKIFASDLVVGDVVQINMGNKVPADLRLVEVTGDMKFDRSILTGENEPVSATVEATDENYLETHNIALLGTHCTNGTGKAVVIATGDKTVFGKIARLSSSTDSETTILQKEIIRFVSTIATLSIGTGCVIMILWAAWLRTTYPTFLSISGILVNAIAVIVAFVPEGMPVAVTLCLTLIAKRSFRQKILCKTLPVVETLGCVSVICSDKTGTLTENRMFVNNVGLVSKEMEIQECKDALRTDGPEKKVVRILQLASCLCNAAMFDPASMSLPVNERAVNGDSTDTGLLRFAEDLRESTTADRLEFKTIYQVPFNSKNKFAITIHRSINENADNDLGTSELILFCKGAPEILLEKCTFYLHPDGSERMLDQESKNLVVAMQDSWSRKGRRVLLLTKKTIPSQVFPGKAVNDIEMTDLALSFNKNLCIIGLVGIVDPPRAEIPEVVRKCRKAGVRVFMVTGDFTLTAEAIARQCGILTSNKVDNINEIIKLGRVEDNARDGVSVRKRNLDSEEDDYQININSLVLNGKDLSSAKLRDEHWDIIANYSEIVFARTTPEQKLKIVTELQKRDNIVGVTGDGVNDAPALKQANIGIAMGLGSDLAVAAGDMVLLDNNFASVVVAMENGRLVFDNLKKVIVYLLPAGSWSELWPVLVNVIFGAPLPLSSFLMIVVCCITDIFPSLSLTHEKAESDIMSRKPRKASREHLVNFKLLLHAYGFVGIMEMIFAHTMFFLYLYKYGGIRISDTMFVYDRWKDGYLGKSMDELNELNYVGQSVYFITLVIMQFGNLLASRTRRRSILQANPFYGPKRNLYLFGAMTISLMTALIILYVPFFNNVFYTRPIPAEFYFIPLGFAAVILTMDEIRKLTVRTYPKSIFGMLAW
ncbi:7033_t:CDS:10 [Acaulospora morrowiae]|uniref:7033_t:CDS:1 n=1 Tax=Acaulospora morrowiae TaxID=94023 RepID=A0A9N9BQH4_9GLOM|nr:7033_t:CDS:10 [Acaulospora morrowiae]